MSSLEGSRVRGRVDKGVAVGESGRGGGDAYARRRWESAKTALG